ncbi:hypothetical protein JYU34_014401 [Plutella xylostella]|uniref:Uncharacterized protein n=1 Tax=Plutella xylostella TaxID=51655 RepID=A0ABQ7Q9P4_PLUXY|nr:hypothetical protein JYU34_014401 [Plutella xylostella]
MSGRAVVVRLLCRDVAAATLDLRAVFTPCVAFRLQGSPPRSAANVTEVQFAPNAHTSEMTASSGLTVSEYVAIGISSLILGLIYVASVFLYLHMKKRRKTASEDSSSVKRIKGLKKKDGTSITEHDIIRINNEHVKTIANAMGEENGIGVVKKNPLLAIGRQYHEIKSFPSDSGSNISDSEDFPDSSTRSDDGRFNNQTTSVLVHPQSREVKLREENSCEAAHRDESSIERLPDEHVSIVETTEDRDIARPVGQTRRKLYFNPAYFEPHLMAEPPQAALEFLVKIREVIAIAKHKMEAKRFQPVLNEIPEEETYPSNGNSIDIYQGLGSQRSGSVVSLKRESSRKKSTPCVGCPGCRSEDSNSIQNFMKYNVPACSTCNHSTGDKQNSIRQWLENIPTVKQQTQFNDTMSNTSQNSSLVNSLQSLPSTHKNKLMKQNSFSGLKDQLRFSESLHPPKKSKSTLSVRSEPPLRNYNLPLPDFESFECQHRNYYGQTISRVDDIRPIGLNNHRPGSARRQSMSNLRSQMIYSGKGVLPDMVNEAIALDHTKGYNQSSSDEERFYKHIPRNATPKNLTRKSSASPPGDYETDSLERMSHKKGVSTPTDYTDIASSQASPSLSNALPLEEELTMMNAIYKGSIRNTPSPFKEVSKTNNDNYEIINQNSNETQNDTTNINGNDNKDYSLVSEVYVNNNYNFGSTPTSPSGSESSLGSRKFNATNTNNIEEVAGCLTIELKDPPENYIKIHESDSFEPDTLDRKCQKQKELFDTTQISRRHLIEKLNAEETKSNSHRIQLRSSGTFKKPNPNSTKFNSLRHIYEAGKPQDRPTISTDTFSRSKSLDCNETWDDTTPDWNTEEGRILSLELRHSKRQRQCTPPTIKEMKNLVRPDILPPLPPTEELPIYEHPPFPPRRVEDITIEHSKNLSGRSLSPRIFMKNTTIDHDPFTTRPNSIHYITQVGPACRPTRASVSSLPSDYENIQNIHNCSHGKTGPIVDLCRTSSRLRNSKSFAGINTNTFVKCKDDHPKVKFRRRKGSTVDDSGYLSSDSASSRQVQRRIVVPKLVSCSESDDSEHEARSESGAESVETHSVFFGSFRKLRSSESDNYSNRSNRALSNSSRKYHMKQSS